MNKKIERHNDHSFGVHNCYCHCRHIAIVFNEHYFCGLHPHNATMPYMNTSPFWHNIKYSTYHFVSFHFMRSPEYITVYIMHIVHYQTMTVYAFVGFFYVWWIAEFVICYCNFSSSDLLHFRCHLFASSVVKFHSNEIRSAWHYNAK